MNDFIPPRMPLDALVIGTNGELGTCAKCLHKFSGMFGDELTFLLAKEGIAEQGDRFMIFDLLKNHGGESYSHEVRKSEVNNILFTYSGKTAEPRGAYGFYEISKEHGPEGSCITRAWKPELIYIFPDIKDYMLKILENL